MDYNLDDNLPSANVLRAATNLNPACEQAPSDRGWTGPTRHVKGVSGAQRRTRRCDQSKLQSELPNSARDSVQASLYIPLKPVFRLSLLLVGPDRLEPPWIL